MKVARIALVFAVILFLVPLEGCHILFPDATKFGDEYYQSLQSKDFQHAIGMCSSKYFDKLPENDAIRLLEVVNSKLGDIISYKVESINGKSTVSNHGSYSRYEIDYSIKYEKGKSKEILIVGKEGLQTKLQVWDYIIDSPDLIFAQ
jgi:hypothetical protein